MKPKKTEPLGRPFWPPFFGGESGGDGAGGKSLPTARETALGPRFQIAEGEESVRPRGGGSQTRGCPCRGKGWFELGLSIAKGIETGTRLAIACLMEIGGIPQHLPIKRL